MTGYRDHGYDPSAYDQPGPVLKPYNWVQWLGVGIAAIGALLLSLYLLGLVGVIPRWIGPSPAPFVLLAASSFLIGSRRAPSVPITDEQRARSLRLLIIVGVIAAAVVGLVAALESGVLSR